MKRWLKRVATGVGALVAIFTLMQCVPYGRTHANPPATREPQWDSAHTRDLVKRACFDCHSNETRWPWYANVAPMSWVVQSDVESARTIVNFSEWNVELYPLAPYSGSSVRTGNMPPDQYRVAHPEANLTRDELTELARGLDATLK